MPAHLSIRRVSVSLAGRPVLSSVSLAIGPESRIGLLGPNGVGKTTLLRVCAGLVTPDSGRVVRAPEDLLVGYLEQEPLARSGETLGELFARRTGVAAALAEAEAVARTMGEDLTAIQQLHRRARSGRRAGRLRSGRARGAGLRAPRCARRPRPAGRDACPVGNVRAPRSRRCRSSASTSCCWTSRRTTSTSTGSTCSRTSSGTSTAGSWRSPTTAPSSTETVDTVHRAGSVHARGVDVRRHVAGLRTGASAPARQATRGPRAHERRAGSVAGTGARDPAPGGTRRREDPQERRVVERDRVRQDPARGGRGSKAVTMRARAERVEVVEKPRDPWVLAMDLMPQALGGESIATLTGAVVERGSFRLGPIDLEIHRGDRIALLGPNGSGKSTLIAALTGDVALAAGTRRIGSATVLGGAQAGPNGVRRRRAAPRSVPGRDRLGPRRGAHAAREVRPRSR